MRGGRFTGRDTFSTAQSPGSTSTLASPESTTAAGTAFPLIISFTDSIRRPSSMLACSATTRVLHGDEVPAAKVARRAVVAPAPVVVRVQLDEAAAAVAEQPHGHQAHLALQLALDLFHHGRARDAAPRLGRDGGHAAGARRLRAPLVADRARHLVHLALQRRDALVAGGHLLARLVSCGVAAEGEEKHGGDRRAHEIEKIAPDRHRLLRVCCCTWNNQRFAVRRRDPSSAAKSPRSAGLTALPPRHTPGDPFAWRRGGRLRAPPVFDAY